MSHDGLVGFKRSFQKISFRARYTTSVSRRSVVSPLSSYLWCHYQSGGSAKTEG